MLAIPSGIPVHPSRLRWPLPCLALPCLALPCLALPCSDIVWPEAGEGPGVLAKSAFQNQRFKLIPQMADAPWVVQMAVSSTPCLLGQKIVQRYFRGPGYVEIDLHVGSSAIADNIVSLCRSYSTSFVCNMGIVLQGESDEELPEALLATVQLHRANLSIRSQLMV
jgi:hypothetical protein